MVLALSLASSCGVSGDPGESGKQASADYQREEMTLRLPADAHWPPNPEPSVAPDGRPQRYGVGAATADADFFWLCAWSNDMYRHESRSVVSQYDARELRRLPRLYLYRTAADDGTRKSFDVVLSTTVTGRKSSALSMLATVGCHGVLQR